MSAESIKALMDKADREFMELLEWDELEEFDDENPCLPEEINDSNRGEWLDMQTHQTVESWLPESGFETLLFWDQDEYRHDDVVLMNIVPHPQPGYFKLSAMIAADDYGERALVWLKRGGNAELIKMWFELHVKNGPPKYVEKSRLGKEPFISDMYKGDGPKGIL